MDIRPLHDRILVQREEEKEVRRGGIVIPDTAKEKPQRGKVLAVGSGRIGEEGNRIPLTVKKGDRVLFEKYSGTEYKSPDGEEYLVMRENDILAVIE